MQASISTSSIRLRHFFTLSFIRNIFKATAHNTTKFLSYWSDHHLRTDNLPKTRYAIALLHHCHSFTQILPKLSRIQYTVSKFKVFLDISVFLFLLYNRYSTPYSLKVRHFNNKLTTTLDQYNLLYSTLLSENALWLSILISKSY